MLKKEQLTDIQLERFNKAIAYLKHTENTTGVALTDDMIVKTALDYAVNPMSNIVLDFVLNLKK